MSIVLASQAMLARPALMGAVDVVPSVTAFASLRRLASASAFAEPGVPQLSIDGGPDTTRPAGKPPVLLEVAAGVSHAAALGDPSALHAAALIDMRWSDGTPAALQRALAALEASASLGTPSASLLADLSAARLLVAGQDDGRILLEAIEAAAAALELDPALGAARFNLTLALHRAALTGRVAESAHRYLAADSTSRWAADVRSWLPGEANRPGRPAISDPTDSAAASALAGHYPEAARVLGWQTTLPRWATRLLNGDSSGAARELIMVSALASRLAADGRDESLFDAVRAIRQADASTALRLARAHQAFAAGEAAHWRADFDAAQAAFERALRDASGAPALALWARSRLGATLVAQGEARDGERLLREVVRMADTVRQPVLSGRALASLGTTLLRSGRDGEAERVIERSERLLVRGGEQETLGAVQTLRADAALRRGDMADGYAAALRTLHTLRDHPHSVWRHNVLFVLTEESYAAGLPRTAGLLQDEGVEASAGTGRPLDLAEALLARARLRAATDQRAGMMEDISRARTLVEAAPAGDDREWVEADLHLALAAAAMLERPATARIHGDSAVAFFAHRDIVLRLVPALGARAEARAALGDFEGALDDLSRAVHVLDRRAASMSASYERGRLLADARRVLERMVMLRIAQGDDLAALHDLERAGALLALGRPLQPGELPTWPTDETGLVLFRVADTLLTWTVDSGGGHLTRTMVRADTLDRLVSRVRTMLELRRPDTEVRPVLSALHDLLLAPVRDRLSGPGRRLVIMTDGSLATVPFPALLDRRSGRHLVEDHQLRFAGALHDAIGARRPRAIAGRGDRAVVLVGDPAFRMADHTGLSRLPGAAVEAATLARRYGEATLLLADKATPARVLDAIGRARVVHFAGHAVLEEGRPELSHLLLAAEPGGASTPAVLRAADVGRLHLPQLELVVLSACQTLGGGGDLLDGTAGLAGAFRLAGADGVLAATWRVDDALTRPLMLAFHDAYAQGRDGPAALRTAQLAMLNSQDAALRSPATWAGFHFLGR